MPKGNDPIPHAKAIGKMLEGVCYPVAKSALGIAGILLEHRLNVEKSAVLAAGLPAVGCESEKTRPVRKRR